MLHVVVLTLALASGECPECERSGWGVLGSPGGTYQAGSSYSTGTPRALALVPPPPLIKHPSVLQVIPCPVVRCVGQNCFSITRPFLPGVPVYDYRKDFNYPWSQAPCALPGPMAAGVPDGYEVIDEPEVVPAPQFEARHRTKPAARITARRTGGVLVTDRIGTAAAKRR